MKAIRFLAHFFGFTKNTDDLSEDEIPENYVDDERLNMIRYQLEFYLSDINLDSDKVFYDAQDENGFIDLNFILKSPRLKRLKATSQDIICSVAHSIYLELNQEQNKVRSKIPYVSDPHRSGRTLKISGFENDLPDFTIRTFLKSILPEGTMLMQLAPKNGEIQFTGSVLYEISDFATAEEIVRRKIAYGNSTLDVELLSDIQKNLSDQKPK